MSIPEPTALPALNGKSVFIRSVTDQRVFEQRPGTPDIPSLGFEGSANASIEIRKRAIARKRNTYGKALGDVLLEENQTVESVIADSLKKSFHELGYKVIPNAAEAEEEPIIVDVSVEEFWSWMNPGFWAITLSSEISTKITLTNYDSKQEEIYVTSQDNYQIASEKNWLEITNRCLQEYDKKNKRNLYIIGSNRIIGKIPSCRRTIRLDIFACHGCCHCVENGWLASGIPCLPLPRYKALRPKRSQEYMPTSPAQKKVFSR